MLAAPDASGPVALAGPRHYTPQSQRARTTTGQALDGALAGGLELALSDAQALRLTASNPTTVLAVMVAKTVFVWPAERGPGRTYSALTPWGCARALLSSVMRPTVRPFVPSSRTTVYLAGFGAVNRTRRVMWSPTLSCVWHPVVGSACGIDLA